MADLNTGVIFTFNTGTPTRVEVTINKDAFTTGEIEDIAETLETILAPVDVLP